MNLRDPKASEYTLVTGFTRGFRAREDDSLLPPGTLVRGSQNVLTNTSNRIAARKGYTLDGEVNTTDEGIESAFDWTKTLNNDTHVRCYGTTMDYRYVNPVTSAVEWTPLYTSLSRALVNFTTFWDTTELFTVMLFVDGSSNIFEWSGGVATFASATANTITKTGTDTWTQAGFYSAGTRSITMYDNGGTARTFTYTGGENTTTLTGVTPDPTTFTFTANETPAAQTVRVTTNASMTSISATFNNDLIGNLAEQIYIGSNTSQTLYISKLSDYTDYSSSSPREPGDGAEKTLGGFLNAMIVQEEDMYISCGTDLWYRTEFVQTTTSVTNGGITVATVYEQINMLQIKTTVLQGAQSQSAVTKIKNYIAYLSFEPIINTLGVVENILQEPRVTDISFPIVDLMNEYNLTGVSMKYFRQFLYVAVPAEGIVLMYNMTNPENMYYEAPQTLPISCFSIIDEAIYGHDSVRPQTYKLFDGYSDNGNNIFSRVQFAFRNYDVRPQTKGFNQFYTEGYISSNCNLTLGINYDMDGCTTNVEYELSGADTQFVCIGGEDASLGKQALGKFPLGSQLEQTSSTELPPKFRWIKTFPRRTFYEEQTYYESIGQNQQWELLSYGGNTELTSEGNNAITD